MSAATVPHGVEDLTPQWVDAVFNQIGLSGTPVTGARPEPIGEGTGFVARSVRLSLEYAGSPGERPGSVVAKIPALPGPTKDFALETRAYELEGLFYERLSADVPFHVPGVFWQDSDPNAGDYCLLLEDLRGYAIGDQMASEVSSSLIAGLLQTAAQMHAQWWNAPKLSSEPWIAGPAGPEMRAYHRNSMRSADPWADEFASAFSADEIRKLIDVMARLPELASEATAEATTLLHGDLRLDNVMLTDQPGKPSPMLIDWQLIHRGSGAQDVAYLLSQSVPTDQRRALEEDWIAAYLAALDRADYGEAEFQRDFAIGLVQAMLVPLNAVDLLSRARRAVASMPDSPAKEQALVRLAAGARFVQATTDRGLLAIGDHKALSQLA